jgi:hypothetical protein
MNTAGFRVFVDARFQRVETSRYIIIFFLNSVSEEQGFYKNLILKIFRKPMKIL